MDFFCSPNKEKIEDSKSSVLECDYDGDATNLYQALESEAWVPVLEFLETGKWEHMFQKDRYPPERQARTWVTRFEKDGSVRWSQLPLHAAIIFKAPKKIIAALVEIYPLGVRCTDDQQMLPLHLAFRFGAEDSVINLLLDRFPEALFTKNNRGKVPTEIDGPLKEKTELIQKVIDMTTKFVSEKQGQFYQEKTKDLQDDLNLQTRLNATLETEKAELEDRLDRTTTELGQNISRVNAELVMLQNEYRKVVKKLSAVSTAVIFENGEKSHHSKSRSRGQLRLDPSATFEDSDRLKSKSRQNTSFVFGRAKSNDISMFVQPSNETSSESRSDQDSTRQLTGSVNENGEIRGSDASQGSRKRLKNRKDKKKRGSSLSNENRLSSFRPVYDYPNDGSKKETIDFGQKIEIPLKKVSSEKLLRRSSSWDSNRSDKFNDFSGRGGSKTRTKKMVLTGKQTSVSQPGSKPPLPRHGFFPGFGNYVE